MQQIFPAAAAGAGLGPDALGRLYAYPQPGPRPWVRANMIASADGAAALAGRSGGLSGAGDRLVFGILRSLADVILVGAGTARAEGYRPVSPRQLRPELRPPGAPPPPIAVLTGRLDLEPGDGLLATIPGRARTIVLTTAAVPPARRAAAARHADVVVTGSSAVTAAVAVTALAERGYRRILTEGGPGLLGQITAAGLLDELCLTYSPVLAGGTAGRILARPPGEPPDGRQDGGHGALADLGLAHVLADDGYLLCRYLRQGSADLTDRDGSAPDEG